MFRKILVILFSLTFLFFSPVAIIAQEERDLADDSTVSQEDLQQLYQDVAEDLKDEGYMYTQDEYNNLDDTYNYEELTPEQQELLEGFGVLGAGVMMVVFMVSGVLGLLSYVFFSLAYMKIAQRLNMENAWWAWVPVLQTILMAQMGDINPWTLLLLLVPGVNVFYILYFAVVSSMKTAEKLGLDKMLGLLVLVPIVQFFFVGYLAWGKYEPKKVEVVAPSPAPTPTDVKE